MTVDHIGIAVLILLFATGFVFRRWYIRQSKTYKISEQFAANHKLTIFDHNPRSEHSTIELALTTHNPAEAASCIFGIELIQKKRELLKIDFNTRPGLEFKQYYDANQSVIRFFIEKRSLLQLIRNEGVRLNRFRFFVKPKSQSFIKSPEFAFSSKFLIFKPESGKYN